MANKSISVFGIYKSLSEAELAVDALLKAGLTQDDISVLLPDNESTRQFAHVKETKAPEGTTTGATTGACGCSATCVGAGGRTTVGGGAGRVGAGVGEGAMVGSGVGDGTAVGPFAASMNCATAAKSALS